MKIDVKTIKELAENIEKYNLNEVTLESEGVKLVLKKEKPVKVEAVQVQQPVVQQYVGVQEEVEVKEEVVEAGEKECITAPMVGTFYKSSAPGNPAFVEVGMNVSAGDTLCIIEAMKLMNEVKATKNCKITKILVENGQTVKKGDKLFEIE
ncbi:acetyl-CoA carboxylase biotin carboxyl carrier protein [uncultured Fusobacterium sp.]|uniref:acetyl-CoA carboxylase biotin carboxyl carrier protein n=1 Tax=Fusobacterium TaxID=848 RepID=UPI00195B432F|nr:acetyl-CoA carboxylase biotin carboxyl carrier protein [uncultured Fusobacterium sp.]MBM6690051.1 acetyl-CoA carboxylase biotin carboxyl carrier protein [Fusobacterium mortiferum]MBM6821868.1 acetyl-CoA carboxylase biotin carboxyl carrier protein [Fusobacterium mortiferum]